MLRKVFPEKSIVKDSGVIVAIFWPHALGKLISSSHENSDGPIFRFENAGDHKVIFHQTFLLQYLREVVIHKNTWSWRNINQFRILTEPEPGCPNCLVSW